MYCIREVLRIGSMIIFHLSKLWKATLFTLCDVIFLVRPQGNWSLLGVKGLNFMLRCHIRTSHNNFPNCILLSGERTWDEFEVNLVIQLHQGPESCQPSALTQVLPCFFVRLHFFLFQFFFVHWWEARVVIKQVGNKSHVQLGISLDDILDTTTKGKWESVLL